MRRQERASSRTGVPHRGSRGETGQRHRTPLKRHDDVSRFHARENGDGRELVGDAAPHRRHPDEGEIDLMLPEPGEGGRTIEFTHEVDVDSGVVESFENVRGTTRDIGVCRQPGRHVVMPSPDHPD